MRLLLAAVLATSLLGSSLAEAGPFAPNRSEGAAPTKNKVKKQKKAKKQKQVDDDGDVVAEKPAKKKPAKPVKAKPVVEDDEEIDEAPVKKVAAKPEKKPVEKKAKPEPVDEELVIIEEPEAKAVAKAEKPAAKKPVPVKAKPAIDDEDEETIAIVEDKPKAAKPKVGAKPVAPAVEEDDEEPDPVDDEETEEEPKRVAALTDDAEQVDTVSVKKSATKSAPHKTRFYFRAGGMKESTKLGAAEFALVTDLPVDTSGLGEGSGVRTEQNKLPVGAIIGVVLPVLKRKLSIETVLGIPSPTKFKATGKLATESLAPTFMNMPTGIEPLGEDLGEVTFAPPIVTAVYRVAKLGPVTPIAGAGLMVLMGRNAKITNSVLNEAGDPKLSIKPSPGLVVQGGLDIALWRRVAARIDVKYVLGMKVNATIEDIAVTPKAIPALGSLEVGDAVMSAKVAPLIIQAGVGVDF